MKNYLVHIKKTFLTWYPVVRFTNNEKKEMRLAVMVADWQELVGEEEESNGGDCDTKGIYADEEVCFIGEKAMKRAMLQV